MTQRKSADRSRWPSQPLTDEEWQERTDQIRALRQEGLSVRAIAQAVGTSVGTVHTTLKLLDSPSFSPKQNRERGRAAQWVDKHFDKTIEALGEANHWLAYLSKDLETLDCVISLSASAELNGARRRVEDAIDTLPRDEGAPPPQAGFARLVAYALNTLPPRRMRGVLTEAFPWVAFLDATAYTEFREHLSENMQECLEEDSLRALETCAAVWRAKVMEQEDAHSDEPTSGEDE